MGYTKYQYGVCGDANDVGDVDDDDDDDVDDDVDGVDDVDDAAPIVMRRGQHIYCSREYSTVLYPHPEHG